MRKLPLLLLLLAGGQAHALVPAHRALLEIQEAMQRGEYRKARRDLEQEPADDPFALRLRMELALRRGERKKTEQLASQILELYAGGRLPTAEAVAQAAFAAWHLERWKEANQLYLETSRLPGVSRSILIDWGDLYLEKYNPAEAESLFRQALKTPGPGYQRWNKAAAWVGLARSLKDQFKPGVREALKRALAMDGGNLAGLALEAELALEEGDWKGARGWIERGLDRNASDLPLLELKAALSFFSGRKKEYRPALAKVLEVNPSDGRVFERLGDLALGRRRLEQAVEFYRQAIRHDSHLWSALASLGINLLRLAQEEEGRRVLEQAYQHDPFNLWTVNTLRLLDSLDRFQQIDTPVFRIRLLRKEAAALRPYVEELLERSLKALEKKYGHTVMGPYFFEMYGDHEDFAVRTLGIPGLGALGATFGRVVAMDSPSARPRGEFHWGSTLWHEVTHVVTLSLSRQRVPRWFTEGISMMEERLAGPGWGDPLNPAFIRAYQEGRLLPLGKLDSGFVHPRSPGDLSLSYLEAAWVCEFLAARFGFQKIPAMLRAYGEGLDTPRVFRQILGRSLEEVEGEFLRQVKSRLDPLVQRLRPPEGFPKVGSPKELETLRGIVQTHPDNYPANLRLGRALLAAKRGLEALPYLEKARALFPSAAGPSSPYPLLVHIYQKQGDSQHELEVRKEWWKVRPYFTENARAIAAKLRAAGDPAGAARYLEEAMYVYPLEVGLHQKLGELYLDGQDPQRARREFEIVLRMGPSDMAAAHYYLARALFQSGQRREAKEQVLLALEIAPAYLEAQKLLLRLVAP